MAFAQAGFSLMEAGGVCGATGQYRFIRARYITLDAAATVEATGYFNSIYQNLPVGSLIDAIMAVGGTPVFKNYIVTASSSAGVTIALQTVSAG